MRRFKTFLFAFLFIVALTTFAYFFGFANTVILASSLLHLAAARTWAIGLKTLIVESQRVTGENDRKLLRRVQGIEDLVRGR